MKKIGILGAGIYQVPLIKKAKEMGIFTVVFSVQGKYPGFQYADKVYYIDTTDAERIGKVAQNEKLDGICTTGTDVCIPALGKVCDELKLTGVSYQAAIYAANKSDMKKKFIEEGVCTAKYCTAHDYEEVQQFLKEAQLPIMIKAVDSSGSRGITKVTENDPSTISEAIKASKRASKLDYFIVEECIEGVEFGAQAFIYHGKVIFVMPHGDYVFNGDTGVPIGHYVPYEIDEDILKESVRQVALSAKALGVDNCAINADFILKDGKVYVLEIGARAGATCLPEMVSTYYGIDFYKMIIQAAMGEELETVSLENLVPNACKLLISEESGVIEDIKLPAVVGSEVIDVSCDYQKGDYVKEFRVGPDRVGQIITKGNTVDEAVKLLDSLVDQVRIIVKEK